MRSCGEKAPGATFGVDWNNHTRCLIALVACLLAGGLRAQSPDPDDLFKEALAREGLLRRELEAARPDEPPSDLLARIRVLVGAYQDLAQLFPAGAQSDDALWQGGVLAADLFRRFGDAADRTRAARLLERLVSGFPESPFAPKARDQVARLDQAAARPTAARGKAAPPPATPVALKAIRRETLPEVLRITLDLDREVSFHEERLDGPARVFIDLQRARAVDTLRDATIPVGDEIVRQIRVGRHPDARTRVVFDLHAPARYSVYALYNPYRVVIDFERGSRHAPAATAQSTAIQSQPAPSVRAVPQVPAPNASGGFSLSRQLGLGVARIVIDPGHGGHDPGAKAHGLTEAGLVLDVALRLEKLLQKERNVEVVLTRRTDDYVTLEERTAIANRSDGDLFLSIHANANASRTARGLETYFLNFAPNPEAEAIAARENAGSSRSMRELPDIVSAIAMNNKRDESRDFATIVQAALYERLRRANRSLRNLGVKQAPFMVLIGAGMPAILSEISFMTNGQEAALLRTERYRQQIAEALAAGVMRYQETLKKIPAVAAQ